LASKKHYFFDLFCIFFKKLNKSGSWKKAKTVKILF